MYILYESTSHSRLEDERSGVLRATHGNMGHEGVPMLQGRTIFQVNMIQKVHV